MSRPVALAIAVLLSLAAPAAAQVHDIARAGGWDAFQGRSNVGTALCGLSTAGSAGRFFAIKHFSGNDHFSIQVKKESWRIPEGTAIPVALTIDGLPAWTATARGEGRWINFNLSGAEKIVDFLRQFRGGLAMSLTFPAGSEPDWSFNLRGTSAVTEAVIACMERHSLRGGAPTQPFGSSAPAPSPRSAPTQPFGDGGIPVGGRPARRT